MGRMGLWLLSSLKGGISMGGGFGMVNTEFYGSVGFLVFNVAAVEVIE